MTPVQLTIDGHVKQVLHLGEADLKAGTPTEIDVSFTSDHGQETAHYTGMTLWTLIERAGLPDEPGKSGAHHLPIA